MGSSLKINGEEVRNPIARLLLSVIALLLFLLVMAFLFLIFLPIVWFSIAMILSAVILLAALGPKILRNYRIVVIETKNRPPSAE